MKYVETIKPVMRDS